MPVYQRLSSNEFLPRCVSGKTQEANEAIHSNIRRMCLYRKNILGLAVTATVKE